MARQTLYNQLFKEMLNIRYRLENIEKNLSGWKPVSVNIPEDKLFTLPDNLRKTYLILASKGESDAAEVSRISGRCRAIESNYLNQLTRMGWLCKRKESKTTMFRLAAEKEV